MKIYIAEDEPLAAAKLKLFLEKAGVNADIQHFSDGAKLLDAIQSGQEADVLFLDIQMPNMTGLQLLEALQQSDIRPEIIITTAYDQYAIDGFNYGVTDYLLKPYTLDRLKTALSKLRCLKEAPQPLQTSVNPCINLRCEGRTEVIPFSSIVCIEALKDYTSFILSDQRRITALGTLGSFEQSLPQGQFMRIQRSYIINLSYVQSYTAQSVRLKSGMEVPLGKTYRDAFEQGFQNS